MLYGCASESLTRAKVLISHACRVTIPRHPVPNSKASIPQTELEGLSKARLACSQSKQQGTEDKHVNTCADFQFFSAGHKLHRFSPAGFRNCEHVEKVGMKRKAGFTTTTRKSIRSSIADAMNGSLGLGPTT